MGVISRWYQNRKNRRWAKQHRTWESLSPDQFKHGMYSDIPIEAYTARFAKQGMCANGWRYRIGISRGLRTEHTWGRYRDGEYGLVLVANENPSALITWDIIEKTVLQIRQIQGVKGAGDRLRPLRWEKMLLQMALDWASVHGLREARSEPAQRHAYYGACGTKGAMRLKYDVTVRRMGFRPVPGQAYFVRMISSQGDSSALPSPVGAQ